LDVQRAGADTATFDERGERLRDHASIHRPVGQGGRQVGVGQAVYLHLVQAQAALLEGDAQSVVHRDAF
jgi:hypothetical protein